MGDFRGYAPDHMMTYQDEPRKTVHETTVESDGTTVIIFNTKVIIVDEEGLVREFARS